jgi:hypothetical protein
VSAVQCQLFSVSCSVSAVQCQLFSVSGSVSVVQCQLFSLRCSVSAINQCTNPANRHKTDRLVYLLHCIGICIGFPTWEYLAPIFLRKWQGPPSPPQITRQSSHVIQFKWTKLAVSGSTPTCLTLGPNETGTLVYETQRKFVKIRLIHISHHRGRNPRWFPDGDIWDICVLIDSYIFTFKGTKKRVPFFTRCRGDSRANVSKLDDNNSFLHLTNALWTMAGNCW